MKVRAIQNGEYANCFIEEGQVFELVEKRGIKNERDAASGRMKKVEFVFSPMDQFSERWMEECKEKKTIQIDRMGDEIIVVAKGKKKKKADADEYNDSDLEVI